MRVAPSYPWFQGTGKHKRDLQDLPLHCWGRDPGCLRRGIGEVRCSVCYGTCWDERAISSSGGRRYLPIRISTTQETYFLLHEKYLPAALSTEDAAWEGLDAEIGGFTGSNDVSKLQLRGLHDLILPCGFICERTRCLIEENIFSKLCPPVGKMVSGAQIEGFGNFESFGADDVRTA